MIVSATRFDCSSRRNEAQISGTLHRYFEKDYEARYLGCYANYLK